ncbi:lysM and putative peptidoglycan-binding domain-containing protein 1 [Phlebotomus argentipes]|uniref:lysM and putative peptidoglycan-binding domain-containing protein 1 n=1 Tax=Phlebotomus argentipes TaxID=94469 RepID=UPI002893556E|nr:lysM and putative peptidoglycan-binding domain-containing protein 1 [Phlebotomus argentipes]
MAMDLIVGAVKIWRMHSGFTEIVTQMEEDSFFTEKQSIRESGRSLKKYGSTCNHVRNTDVLVRHEVEKTDTLQGIALKYGCSTEQIRRANRLYASDSLFLRQYLMVPVDRNSPYAPKDERPHSLPPQRANTFAGSCSTDTNANSRSLDHMAMSPDEENRRSVDEFLGKIDSTIAESRKYVKKSQNSIDFLSPDCVDGDGMFSPTSKRSNSASYSHPGSSSHHRNSSSGSDSSHLIMMTQGRHVQNSLQRLERQQDELFEL